jgi:hypothetical protein
MEDRTMTQHTRIWFDGFPALLDDMGNIFGLFDEDYPQDIVNLGKSQHIPAFKIKPRFGKDSEIDREMRQLEQDGAAWRASLAH